jgi:hypothetical protein
MSEYEDLVERCAKGAFENRVSYQGSGPSPQPWTWEGADERVRNYWRAIVRAVLAEVLRTLEAVTPEMRAAVEVSGDVSLAVVCFETMLRASPVAGPR